MNWQEIRQQHPRSWLVVEAIDAHTEGTSRVIDRLAVIGVFGKDWQLAWEQYKQIHQLDRQREYYVLHTERAELDIGVLDTFGRALKE